MVILLSGLGLNIVNTEMLHNDVLMGIISKLLGHSKMQTTQEHYGKIVQKKISLEIEKLKEEEIICAHGLIIKRYLL